MGTLIHRPQPPRLLLAQPVGLGDAAGLRCPEPMPSNPEKLGRFLLRGLRIGASTVSIVELLRSDWTGGITAGVAWLVFLQVERRLPPVTEEPAD